SICAKHDFAAAMETSILGSTSSSGKSDSLTAPAALATAAGTFCFRAGFVYVNAASAELAAVQTGNCLLAFFRIRHLYKTKPARTASIAIGKYAHSIHVPVRLE